MDRRKPSGSINDIHGFMKKWRQKRWTKRFNKWLQTEGGMPGWALFDSTSNYYLKKALKKMREK